MKLHFKTTLLVSAITLAVLVALVCLMGARLANVLRAEERKATDLEATYLAEQYSHQMPDAEVLQKTAPLVRGTRQERLNIRIWKRSGAEFIPALTTSPRVREMPAEATAQLLQQQIARVESDYPIEHSNANYRIFVPITQAGQVIGAVEVSNHLDTLPTVLQQFLGTTLWLALLAVSLIAVTSYLLSRFLIERPIGHVLTAIAKAKEGTLDVQVPQRRQDEVGTLSQEFNRLLAQLYQMTTEREQQQSRLQEAVQEATAQLRERNQQLETANLELWRTSQRLTQLERLAAAGQTATQFAHEVGTPLNLISCHAQLMQVELTTQPAAAVEHTEMILTQTERIESIVRQMLDRTHPEKRELSPLNLNHLLKSIAETTAPLLVEHNIALQLSLAPTLPAVVGDADKLQQAFINLINNAVEAMSEGGQLTITTTLQTSGKNGHAPQAQVKFVDTGCGLTPQSQARIFDPLYAMRGKGA
ncbi:MAG TPA: ATP-binding protein, partial [Blastocatellia bacterium]|nr:ATP-binding protein [Blastocatellia bacterium]